MKLINKTIQKKQLHPMHVYTPLSEKEAGQTSLYCQWKDSYFQDNDDTEDLDDIDDFEEEDLEDNAFESPYSDDEDDEDSDLEDDMSMSLFNDEEELPEDEEGYI